MTIVEFLEARIAEDEAVARRAGGPSHTPCLHWEAGETNGDGIRRIDGVPVAGHSWPHEMDHIARHDPARVLAECAAKRRLLRAHAKWCHNVHDTQYPNMDYDASYWWTLLVFASVYADHPDFQEEWRP